MARSYLLLLLGVGLSLIAFAQGGWTYLVGWLGIDFLVLGIAHIRGFHRLFGKRADGTLPFWSWMIFLPLHLYSLAVLKFARTIRNEPWNSDVNEMLSIGSRPFVRDDCANFDSIVDLTAEFQEVKSVRQRPGYISFPILDASAPSAHALELALNACHSGRMFIHCAQGHGRTGLFAAAWLLANGVAANAGEALQILTKARPGINLNSEQRRCLSEIENRFKLINRLTT
jgi:protein-tyrosine phosphatase